MPPPRHGRACPDHPRLFFFVCKLQRMSAHRHPGPCAEDARLGNAAGKTSMVGPSPTMAARYAPQFYKYLFYRHTAAISTGGILHESFDLLCRYRKLLLWTIETGTKCELRRLPLLPSRLPTANFLSSGSICRHGGHNACLGCRACICPYNFFCRAITDLWNGGRRSYAIKALYGLCIDFSYI